MAEQNIDEILRVRIVGNPPEDEHLGSPLGQVVHHLLLRLPGPEVHVLRLLVVRLYHPFPRQLAVPPGGLGRRGGLRGAMDEVRVIVARAAVRICRRVWLVL